MRPTCRPDAAAADHRGYIRQAMRIGQTQKGPPEAGLFQVTFGDIAISA
jgi:hypothetical protein